MLIGESKWCITQSGIGLINMNKIKLGITYSLFSGEELLPYSILSIKRHVDYVNVVYQKFSWFGDPCSSIVEPILKYLKNNGLIDRVIEYTFSDFGNINTMSYHVLNKKNIGVEDLKRNDCTHCMIMDTDEFYFSDEFAKAKQFVISNEITHSACSIYDYRHLPEIRNRDCSRYAVPFIFKLNSDSMLSVNHNMPCLVDSLRTFPYDQNKDKFYYLNSIFMHHMTGIRFDYDKKLKASVTNSSKEGRGFVSSWKNNFDREAILSKEEILKLSNDFGGYIDVGDPFNLNQMLNLKEKSLIIPPP